MLAESCACVYFSFRRVKSTDVDQEIHECLFNLKLTPDMVVDMDYFVR